MHRHNGGKPDSMQKLKTVCDLAVKNYSELKIYLQ